MAEDEETQHRGIVTVGIVASPPWRDTEKAVNDLYSSLKDIGSMIARWCPVKCNAHHHWIFEDSNNEQNCANRTCLTSTTTGDSEGIATESKQFKRRSGTSANCDVLISGQLVFSTIMRCMGREYRIRTRMHKG